MGSFQQGKKARNVTSFIRDDFHVSGSPVCKMCSWENVSFNNKIKFVIFGDFEKETVTPSSGFVHIAASFTQNLDQIFFFNDLFKDVRPSPRL